MRSRTRDRLQLPSRREVEQSTRRKLLESAGRIFAEKGVDRATAKEICEQAGTNTAAVNYYFGGIDGLYAAVIQEAHNQLVTAESLSAAVSGKPDPKSKLEALLAKFVEMLTGPAASSWPARILSREVLFPSPGLAEMHEKERLGKLRILRAIVAELLGLPEDHETVARGCLSVMAPCLMLLIVDRHSLRRAFPNLAVDAVSADVLARHLARFALAGLAASAPMEREAA